MLKTNETVFTVYDEKSSILMSNATFSSPSHVSCAFWSRILSLNENLLFKGSGNLRTDYPLSPYPPRVRASSCLLVCESWFRYPLPHRSHATLTRGLSLLQEYTRVLGCFRYCEVEGYFHHLILRMGRGDWGRYLNSRTHQNILYLNIYSHQNKRARFRRRAGTSYNP